MRGAPLSRKAIYLLLDKIDRIEIIGETTIGGVSTPVDGTIPQISEGNEIFNFNYTPKIAGSLIVLTSKATYRPSAGGPQTLVYCLFLDSAVNAVQTEQKVTEIAGASAPIDLEHSFTTIDTVAINFQLRIGADGIGINKLNVASNTGQNLGDSIRTWVDLEEWAPPSLFRSTS